ncbi:MAG: flagellar biosynthesis anti-sigma factor FlgM [Acidimicrobiia bacterium]
MQNDLDVMRDDEELRTVDAVLRAQRIALMRNRIDAGLYRPSADAVAESLVAWAAVAS